MALKDTIIDDQSLKNWANFLCRYALSLARLQLYMELIIKDGSVIQLNYNSQYVAI